jgi:hypothetical protein
MHPEYYQSVLDFYFFINDNQLDFYVGDRTGELNKSITIKTMLMVFIVIREYFYVILLG